MATRGFESGLLWKASAIALTGPISLTHSVSFRVLFLVAFGVKIGPPTFHAQAEESQRWVGGIKHTATGEVDYTEDFFGKKAYLTVSGQLQVWGAGWRG